MPSDSARSGSPRALTALGTALLLEDPLTARPELERARELARQTGDDWCLVESTEILATTFIMQADPTALSLLEDAYAVYSGYAEFAAWYWWGVGAVHQWHGRDEEALAAFTRAIEAADAVGEPVSGGTAHGFRAMVRAERGEGALALPELEPPMQNAVAAGAGFAMPALLAAMFYARGSIGQLQEARDSLAWYVDANIGGGPYANSLVLCYLARVELSLGQIDHATAHARQASELNDRHVHNPQIAATARLRLAMATLRRGEPAEAEHVAHEALAAAIEHDLRPLLYPLLDVLAGVAVALESYEEGARIIGAAERAREEIGHVRWAHEQRGAEALVARVEAEIGDEATAAAVDAGRSMSSDEAIGWLRRARGARKRPAGGWESLTPTELQVVELAAQGLTNPEIGERMFISRGTVKIHLSHIYAKLDVRNRSQLAAVAAQRRRT